ncbi:MAG: T9SS type A sorting domain-containing protein [Bacteroidota bacterium]
MNNKNFFTCLICLLASILTINTNAQSRCSINIDAVNTYCTGNTVIHTTVTSDVPSYTLTFTPATSLGGDSFLVTGYTGIVTGSLTTGSGCSDMVTVPVIPFASKKDTLYICDTFMHDLMANSGADSYLWSDGTTADFIDVNTPGLYWCATTYAACGTLYDTFVVIANTTYYPEYPTSRVINLCYGDTTTLFVGLGAASYVWSAMGRGFISTLPDSTAYLPIDSANTYICNVTDFCGHSFTYTFTVTGAACYNLVWPGDASADGIANMYDFLYIANAMGDTGSVRAGATTTWVGQTATDWATTSWGWTPVNSKHSDCDGNGVVDYLDFAPLISNYGLIHFRGNGSGSGSRADDPTIPNITLHANYDTCGTSTVVSVDVLLGDATKPIDSISSIVLEFHFDPTLIDTNTININYTGSWLGTLGSNLVSFQKNLFDNARIDIGASRTDHINKNGYGKLATISFVTTDNLSGIANCPLNIGNYLAITKSADTVELDAINDTLYLDPQKSTAIEDIAKLEASITAYPNPASQVLMLVSPTYTMESISIQNALGQTVYTKASQAKQTQLDLNTLGNGIYYISIEMNGQFVHKKIEIIK